MRHGKSHTHKIVFALSFSLASGCASPTSAPRTDTIPGVPDAPFPYASPERVGLNASEIAEIANTVHGWAAEQRVVGAEVMLVKDRRIVLHQASGWSDRERDIPLERNSIFRIRSMTKPFVGTAIMILVEDGRLNLEDAVAHHIPSFDNERSRGITIQHLLRHRGGFVQDSYPEGYWYQGTLRRAVDIVGELGPPYPPGMEFRYADLSTAILGAVVAELTGSPVEEFLQARIFEPLGLQDTHSYFTTNSSWAHRMNSTYRLEGGSWTKYWDNTMSQETPFFRAAGGLYSTVFDYARFLTVWMDRGQHDGGSLLTAESVAEALQGRDGPISWEGSLPSADYGYHWDLYAGAGSPSGLPTFGHGGSDGTVAVAFPEQDVLALYFTQSRGTHTVIEFLELVLEQFGS